MDKTEVPKYLTLLIRRVILCENSQNLGDNLNAVNSHTQTM